MSTIFVSTQHDIIKDAFALLNIYGAAESIDANDYELAKRFLNRMIKTWMSQGYHLWLKETGTIFLKKGQNTYHISSNSPDNVTTSYNQTTLSEDALEGADHIKVTDNTGMATGDYLGIILDNLDLWWTKIDVISFQGEIYFTSGETLPGNASISSIVYFYKTKIENPLNVYSAVRHQYNIDTPMNYLSYEEYFQLPNKNDFTSTPVSYNYDRQLNSAVIRIWPTPDRGDFTVKITFSRKIENIDLNSDEPDFPQEWHEAIVYNLAIRVAPAFGKNKDNSYQMLVALASEFLQNATGFDEEPGSIYLKPDLRYGKN